MLRTQKNHRMQHRERNAVCSNVEERRLQRRVQRPQGIRALSPSGRCSRRLKHAFVKESDWVAPNVLE